MGSATDADGNSCAFYTADDSYCSYKAPFGLDDDDFNSTDMCCACGGGAWTMTCMDEDTNGNPMACYAQDGTCTNRADSVQLQYFDTTT